MKDNVSALVETTTMPHLKISVTNALITAKLVLEKPLAKHAILDLFMMQFMDVSVPLKPLSFMKELVILSAHQDTTQTVTEESAKNVLWVAKLVWTHQFVKSVSILLSS
jgi:hypothetical protein